MPSKSRGVGAKRQKTGNGAAKSSGAATVPAADLASPLVDATFTDTKRADFREKYTSAHPYNHIVVPDVAKDNVLRQVREEIVGNLRATFKETDIYKMFQTGDLNNLDLLDKDSLSQLGTLDALRKALYSPKMRRWMSELLDCGELVERTDIACNVHAQGCHLLCHDDVIGTRRVSFILYLTDPDEPWCADDGGALELYGLEDGRVGVPEVHPSHSVLPKWNHMAVFEVLPGRSFHSIGEVLTDGKPRLAIQGWFHAAEKPKGTEKATLAQLTARSATEAAERFVARKARGGVSGGVSSFVSTLTKAERALLEEFVNPEYLRDDVLRQTREKFEAGEDSIQLGGFLRADVADAIAAAGVEEDTADGLGNGKAAPYSAGTARGWIATGPPHKQRFMRYDPRKAKCEGAGAGKLLDRVRTRLMASEAFMKLVAYIARGSVVGHRGQVRRFRPGCDYTIAHYGQLIPEGDFVLDATLCMVEDGSDEARYAWGSDNVGGFECYTPAEEGEDTAEAAEAYGAKKGKGGDDGSDDEDGAALLSVSAARNSLNLVLRGGGVMRFVKFVSTAAPGSRWDVAMEYEMGEMEGSDDEAD
ncbi:unnamed protein product [Pedinophyceae sp. YPF-701]|nr:unnamed protein product [Pedinophyceae sp. YPF-701]